jgi:alkanesulfonate monooxygenase
MGQQRQTTHDTRYDIADDYMAVVYKLWEGSWEDGAVKADRAARVFADPARVHRVKHDGPYYQLDAIHLSEPSPQRTPVLYQAGASGRGRQFAAEHAECVKILSLATPIVGRTSTEAQDKRDEYLQYISHEGALALLSGWLGVDLSQVGLDETVSQVKTEAIQSALEQLVRNDPEGHWTVRRLAEKAGMGGRSPLFVGSGGEVAEAMIDWVDGTGIDGFNLAYVVMPESFEDLVHLVVPELQARGRYKTAYRPGGLRQKLFGRPRLPDGHPAAAYRP